MNSTGKDLYRTYDPKFTTYRGDGMGRDAYIMHNDGGLINATQFPKGLGPKNPWQQSPVLVGPKVYGKLVRPIPSMYYPPDGTGRDTYIITDNGGTT